MQIYPALLHITTTSRNGSNYHVSAHVCRESLERDAIETAHNTQWCIEGADDGDGFTAFGPGHTEPEAFATEFDAAEWVLYTHDGGISRIEPVVIFGELGDTIEDVASRITYELELSDDGDDEQYAVEMMLASQLKEVGGYVVLGNE